MLIFDQLKRDNPELRMLTLVILAGMLVLLTGLWWVQIVSARDYQENLQTQSFRTVRIPAVRGKILDRNGIVLAENLPNYNIGLYLEELREEFRKTYARSRPVKTVTNSFPFWRRWFGSTTVKTQYVKLNRAQTEALIWQARYQVASNAVQRISLHLQQPQLLSLDPTNFRRHYETRLALPYIVTKNIGPAQIARFEEQFTSPMGVDLEIQSVRSYPYQTTAAHLLGELRRDDRSIAGEAAFFSYRLPDYRGTVGIEAGYDSQLHGRAGAKSVLVNNLGYRQTENIWSPAEPGSNVVLTIDLHIQQASERALQQLGPYGAGTRGAVVVMDVESGDILTLASAPAFNPNHFAQGFPPGEFQRVQALSAEKNRATQENYAPGSIFKVVVGLACLEAGLDPNATVHNPGFIYIGRRLIHDLAAPGDYDFRRAIMYSSNTYFITNGLKAGVEKIVKLGQRLHLGEVIDLPTRQETAGVFPSLERIRSGWSGGDTANLCIGQGYISVTPLQMAVMAAALANDGRVLWPRLVDRIESQNPTSDPPAILPHGRVRDQLGVSRRNLQLLRDAMRDEVEDAGTGARAVVPGLRICGKTGTAQIANDRNQIIDHTTWFMSFAPYEKPRWAVVVMVESGASGALTCAPIAGKIYEALLESERTNASRSGAIASAN